MINDSIKGDFTVLGIFGDPVEHSFSPTIHNTVAKMLGKNFVYVPFHVKKEGLGAAADGAFNMSVAGLNITVPHKIEIMKFLCGIDKQAEAIGAVNTLKLTENGYVGYNTDVTGVGRALEKRGFSFEGKTALLLGAGGAANACGVCAASRGAKRLVIANRTVEKAEALSERIAKYYPETKTEAINLEAVADMGRADIILNATTIGFGEKEGLSPIDENTAAKLEAEIIFDAIYVPQKTRLLEIGEKLGAKIVNGFDMLVFQALAAEEIWFDMKFSPEEEKEISSCLEKYFTENRK